MRESRAGAGRRGVGQRGALPNVYFIDGRQAMEPFKWPLALPCHDNLLILRVNTDIGNNIIKSLL